MKVSQELREKLLACDSAADFEMLQTLEKAQPGEVIHMLRIVIAPQYMNAEPVRRRAQKAKHQRDALWAIGEIAGCGQNQYNGRLVYNQIDRTAVGIQFGTAETVLAVLEKLNAQGLLESVFPDGHHHGGTSHGDECAR